MAKITLGQIANEGFTTAMQLLLTKPVPIRTAFKVKTLVNRFNEELKKLHELRVALMTRHCKKDAEDKPILDEKQNYTFEPAGMMEVSKEMHDLTSIEVEFTPVKLEEFGDIDLTTQNLFDLGDIVEI